MREIGFRRYLEGLCLKKSNVGYLLSCCRKVEQDFRLDLDNIIKSEQATRNLIHQIGSHPRYNQRQKINLPTALKKYYQWANGELKLLSNDTGPKWQPKPKWCI